MRANRQKSSDRYRMNVRFDQHGSIIREFIPVVEAMHGRFVIIFSTRSRSKNNYSFRSRAPSLYIFDNESITLFIFIHFQSIFAEKMANRFETFTLDEDTMKIIKLR